MLQFCGSLLKIHNILWFKNKFSNPNVQFLFTYFLPDRKFSLSLITKEGRILPSPLFIKAYKTGFGLSIIT